MDNANQNQKTNDIEKAGRNFFKKSEANKQLFSKLANINGKERVMAVVKPSLEKACSFLSNLPDDLR